jgi:hypothetical protein
MLHADGQPDPTKLATVAFSNFTNASDKMSNRHNKYRYWWMRGGGGEWYKHGQLKIWTGWQEKWNVSMAPLQKWSWRTVWTLSVNNSLTPRKNVFHYWRHGTAPPINSVCYLKFILHRYTEYFFEVYKAHHQNITERYDLQQQFCLELRKNSSPPHSYQQFRHAVGEVNMATLP